jgi:hypothetical protein
MGVLRILAVVLLTGHAQIYATITISPIHNMQSYPLCLRYRDYATLEHKTTATPQSQLYGTTLPAGSATDGDATNVRTTTSGLPTYAQDSLWSTESKPQHIIILWIILRGVRLSPLGTAATTGLLYQHQMVIVEQLLEWRLEGKTEVLGESLAQRHFVHHKSHMTRTVFEPGLPRWEASD